MLKKISASMLIICLLFTLTSCLNDNLLSENIKKVKSSSISSSDEIINLNSFENGDYYKISCSSDIDSISIYCYTTDEEGITENLVKRIYNDNHTMTEFYIKNSFEEDNITYKIVVTAINFKIEKYNLYSSNNKPILILTDRDDQNNA